MPILELALYVPDIPATRRLHYPEVFRKPVDEVHMAELPPSLQHSYELAAFEAHWHLISQLEAAHLRGELWQCGSSCQ